jgi:hypothetical protein
MRKKFLSEELKRSDHAEYLGVVKVKQSRYTPWRRLGGEEV